MQWVSYIFFELQYTRLICPCVAICKDCINIGYVYSCPCINLLEVHVFESWIKAQVMDKGLVQLAYRINQDPHVDNRICTKSKIKMKTLSVLEIGNDISKKAI